jgi:hypothetical protein
MADHHDHMDQDHALEAEEAQVMLGFAEPVDLEEHGPLLAEDFCSKMGGLPVSTALFYCCINAEIPSRGRERPIVTNNFWSFSIVDLAES